MSLVLSVSWWPGLDSWEELGAANKETVLGKLGAQTHTEAVGGGHFCPSKPSYRKDERKPEMGRGDSKQDLEVWRSELVRRQRADPLSL